MVEVLAMRTVLLNFMAASRRRYEWTKVGSAAL
jgi:hypothetical protein